MIKSYEPECGREADVKADVHEIECIHVTLVDKFQVEADVKADVHEIVPAGG